MGLCRICASGVRSIKVTKGSFQPLSLSRAARFKASSFLVPVGSALSNWFVPYKNAVVLQAKLVKDSTLKIYPGYPHGMLSVHADVINPDLLAFIRS